MLTARIGLSLRQATGLAISPATLAYAVKQRMKQCAITHGDAYAARFEQDSGELAALIELVVVPETWFFRDPEAFRVAAQAHSAQPYRVRDYLDGPTGFF